MLKRPSTKSLLQDRVCGVANNKLLPLGDNLTNEAVSTTGENDRYDGARVLNNWKGARRSVLNIARIHSSRGERIRRTRMCTCTRSVTRNSVRSSHRDNDRVNTSSLQCNTALNVHVLLHDVSPEAESRPTQTGIKVSFGSFRRCQLGGRTLSNADGLSVLNALT